MIFESLDIGTQNIILYNYETTTKFFIIVLFLFLSLLYLFVTSKKFKTTDNPLVSVFRVILWIASSVYMYSFPLVYIFLMYPSYASDTLIMTLLRFYSIGFIFITLYIVWNFAVMLPLQLVKVGKLNPEKFKNTLLKNVKLDKLKIK